MEDFPIRRIRIPLNHRPAGFQVRRRGRRPRGRRSRLARPLPRLRLRLVLQPELPSSRPEHATPGRQQGPQTQEEAVRLALDLLEPGTVIAEVGADDRQEAEAACSGWWSLVDEWVGE